MTRVVGSILLVLVMGGCAGTEKVQMDTARIVPDANGKCTAMAGMREIRVACPNQ